MAYLMLESSVRTHPKFLAAGPEASWLWVCGLGYCQDGLTDGFIPTAAVDFLGVREARRLADRLVDVALWEVEPGGWQMHDYLEHNKSAEQVREIMRKRAEGGKLGGRPRKNLEGSFETSKVNLTGNPILPVLPVLPEQPTTKSVSLTPSAATSKPTAPSVLVFPVTGKGGPEWHLTKAQVTEWSELFPGLDVLAEARKALAWVKANAGHRKTAMGMPRFLVNWFSRTVNRGGAKGAEVAASDRPFTATELREASDWYRRIGTSLDRDVPRQEHIARFIRKQRGLQVAS